MTPAMSTQYFDFAAKSRLRIPEQSENMQTFLYGICAASRDDTGRAGAYAALMSDRILPQAKHPRLILVVATELFANHRPQE